MSKRPGGGFVRQHTAQPRSKSPGRRAEPLLRSSRDIAVEVLRRAQTEGAYVHLLLPSVIERTGLRGADAGLATELTLGSARNFRRLVRLAARHITGRSKISMESGGLEDGIIECLVVGAYQLIYTDRIPMHAAVSETVDSCKRLVNVGAARLVNAVLRAIASKSKEELLAEIVSFETSPSAHLADEHSLEPWIAKVFLDYLGPKEAHAFAHAVSRPSAPSYRVVDLKGSHIDDSVNDVLARNDFLVAHPVIPGVVTLTDRRRTEAADALVNAGVLMRQGAASALVPLVLGAREGEKVIDMCAAPGGKTLHLAEMVGRTGKVLAVDDDAERLRVVAVRTAQAGHDNVMALCADGRVLPDEYLGWADRILLDAPCTGLGLLGKRPDIGWHRSAGDIAELAKIQRELLAAAVRYLKPGGLISYSTCTLTRQENEEVVMSAVGGDSSGDPASDTARGHASGPALLLEHPLSQFQVGEGAQVKEGKLARSLVPLFGKECAIRLLPQAQQTDGFFVALLRKPAQ